MNTLLAACVQFVAGPDKSENIERMAPLVARAAARGAKLVLLPEKWNAVADGPELARYAERLDGGETVDALAGWAREHRIDLICGSIAIEGAGNGPGVGNVSIAFAPRRQPSPPRTPRSTCSTSTSAGSPTASRTARRPAPTWWSPSWPACRSA